MTTQVKKQQKSIREQLSELLNFRQIRDSFQQLGLTIGKDKTNSDENIKIKGGLDADELYLSEINRLIPGDVTHQAAVFVYDTSKDSDGGAWRKRVSHTSWATEPLDQSDRGNRRDFPAIAVIVAEPKRLVIYDADHEDLRMWMSFDAVTAGDNILAFGYDTQELTAVYMLNGVLCVGQRRPDNLTDQGIWRINFISDQTDMILGAGAGDKHLSIYNGGINSRNSGAGYIQLDNSIELISNITWVRDIHMCVLPDAPIDPATKLPVPTVAIASGVANSNQGWVGNVQGAVDVLRHDGTSVTLWNTGGYKDLVKLFPSGGIMAIGGGGIAYRTWGFKTIPSSDSNGGDFTVGANTDGSNNNTIIRPGNSGNAYIHTGGFTNDKNNNVMSFYELTPQPDSGTTGQRAYMYGYPAVHNIAYDDNFENFGLSRHNMIGQHFNTGWMTGPSEKRIATCCDCTPGTIGVDEDTNLITNGNFSDDLDGWKLRNGEITAFSVADNKLTLTGTTPGGYDQLEQTIKTTPGNMYELSLDVAYLNNYPFIGLKNVNDEWIQNVQLHTTNGYTAGLIERFSYSFVATTQETTLIIGGNSANGDGATFENIKITETNNFVKNGRSFWTGNTANDVHEWHVKNTGTLTRETDGRMRIDSTSYATAYTYLDGLIAGEQYHIRAQFNGGTDYTDFDVRLHDGPAGIDSGNNATKGKTTGSVTGEMNFSFRATSSQMILSVIPGRGSIVSGTSWVHLVVCRRAINDYGLIKTDSKTNGFEIQGRVEKQRINPNGDLCMITGYDNNANLLVNRFPHFDWSNDWTITGWCPTGFGKLSIETADNQNPTYNATVFMIHIYNNMRAIRSRNSGTPSGYYQGSNFFAAAYSRADGCIRVYNHTGQVVTVIDDNGYPFNSTDQARIWIGKSTYNGQIQTLESGNYSMCLLKIVQRELSGEQIRDTHDREYKLIHADAPVSLSDARTYSSAQLALDEHTGELLVKTPDSIDTFVDSVRVESKPGAAGSGTRNTSDEPYVNQAFDVANGVIVRT